MGVTTAPRASRRLGLVAVIAALVLTGCGSDPEQDADDPNSAASSATSSSSTTPTPSTSPSTGAARPVPACAKVWVEGATLPKPYLGCRKAGKLVAPSRIGCSSGQAFVRYADRFWAVAGGPIARTEGPLLDDDNYRSKLDVCRG